MIIIIILCIIFWKQTSTQEEEGFKNINVNKQEYNKYNETYIQFDNEDTESKEVKEATESKDNKEDQKGKTNKNLKKKTNSNEVWNNMNLDQCLQKCSQSEDCIAISRDYTEDHEKANCYPRKTLGVVHSNRKGNANQRKNATHYNTYVKSHVPNQIKCINDNKLNMNQNVI